MAVTARSSNHAVPVLPAAPAQIATARSPPPVVKTCRTCAQSVVPFCGGVRSGPASSSELPPAAMNAPLPLRPAVRIDPLTT